MRFENVFQALKEGKKIKRTVWRGFWQLENGKVMMHCKDGKVMDIQETKDIIYTLSNIAADDWEVVDEEYTFETVNTMRFGEALRCLKAGQRVARRGWNGKGMFVVYQKGYPQGIPCNKQTAEAWGMIEGDLFKCNPYLQIKQVDGSHSMWVPSIGDVLAEDWVIVE